MTRYVAFLRAINVGGHVVKMDRLRALFEAVPLSGVETFIASGNVLFDTKATDIAKLEQRIEAKLAAALGYDVETFVRPLAAMKDIAAAHPFAEGPGHTLYVGFVKDAPAPASLVAIQRVATPDDAFHLGDREFYWFRRGGMGDSKLGGGALQKALGQPTTMRNVTTIRRLATRA